MKKCLTISVIAICASIWGCSSTNIQTPGLKNNAMIVSNELAAKYGSFPFLINIPTPTDSFAREFNAEVAGEFKAIRKDSLTLSGFVTHNKHFLEKVIIPALQPYMEILKKQSKREMINTLTLFGHQMFRTYFGYDFYRWGGDLMDLDDPQFEDTRHEYLYGLDCSGFSTFAYELAVYTGLLQADDPAAVFSSKGYELYCKKNNIKDKGGREGTSNNYRLDTSEMISLGHEVFTVDKESVPDDDLIAELKAGDLVGRNGHFGIIVEINSKPYYLESGGWVVPNAGGYPYPAKEALAISSRKGKLTVRRVLPD